VRCQAPHCRIGEGWVVDWPQLKYKITAVRAGGKNPNYTAYGLLQFAENDASPGRYNGFFLDFNEETRNDFSGWRLTEAECRSCSDHTKAFGEALIEAARTRLGSLPMGTGREEGQPDGSKSSQNAAEPLCPREASSDDKTHPGA